MPGLINDEQTTTTLLGQPVAQAGTTTYDPFTRTVDAPKETVQGQLSSVLSSGSPLLTAAKTGAMQTANQRGLLNSSIAAGAGEEALIRTALPIASQDADVYGTASRENMLARNQALQFGAGETNVNARYNTDALNQISRMGYGAGLETGLIGARGEQERLGIAASGEQQRLNIGTTGTQERMTQAEGAIQRAALSAQEAMQTSGLSAQQASQQQAQAILEGEIRAGLITTEEQAQARLRQLQGEIEQQLIGARGDVESTLQAERAAQEQQLTTLRGQIETQLQQLKGTQATTLANIEAAYRSLIQANASASGFYQDIVQGLSTILSNTNTSTEQKQAAVDQMTNFLESGLTIIGAIANVDLAGLLDFTP